MKDMAINVTVRVRLHVQHRDLLAGARATSVKKKFAAFFARVGGAASLVGLESVPISSLPEAVSLDGKAVSLDAGLVCYLRNSPLHARRPRAHPRAAAGGQRRAQRDLSTRVPPPACAQGGPKCGAGGIRGISAFEAFRLCNA